MHKLITEQLVKKLIASQFPQWKHLPVEFVHNGGNDNRTFRLGNTMLTRLPSAERYASQIEKEAKWLPILVKGLSIPITIPLAIGSPELGYPFHWSINKWIEGSPLNLQDTNKTQIVYTVAKFLKELHAIDSSNGPTAGPHNFYRGGNLSQYHPETERALTSLEGIIDTSICRKIWQRAMSSNWEQKGVWVHGDMAIGNLLQDGISLTGIIDFGLLGVGDPACDLVLAWTYFDGESRQVFAAELALDGATWERARGWALWKALITYNTPLSKRVLSALLMEEL